MPWGRDSEVPGPPFARLDGLHEAPAPEEALRDWALSGAMALTGRAAGPPTAADGFAATSVRRALDLLRAGGSSPLPDMTLLSMRAHSLGLGRNAPMSCGGAMRVLPCADGWLALSLSRSSDLDLVPALVLADGPTATTAPWDVVGDWCLTVGADSAASRARLLGLPAATVAGQARRTEPTRGWCVSRPGGERRPLDDLKGARVLDLSALWAGPLCAHLLGRLGAEVLVVESPHRIDGSRATPTFRTALRRGHAHEWVDLSTQSGCSRLRLLADEADLVISSSRPRAFEQIGIDVPATVERGTSWLAISAYGWQGPGRDLVGFGDDVAAGAGLLAWGRASVGDPGQASPSPPTAATGPGTDVRAPWPAGDALADPLTGVHAALAAVSALNHELAWFVDVSMHDVCRAVSRLEPPPHDVLAAGGRWWLDLGTGTPTKITEQW